jgi:hypothetical protein
MWSKGKPHMMAQPRAACTGPVTRRHFIEVGCAALGGLSLGQVCAGGAASASIPAPRTKRNTSVILLYLHGGPSQLETYDLKPDAPSSYRSVFGPISTAVPGMDICELFPLQAQLADKFSIIRSLTHDIPIHSDGGIITLTGKRPSRLDPSSQSKSEHPDFGSVASRVRGEAAGGIPLYVAIPRHPYMTQPTYLGVRHGAFEIQDPSAPPTILKLIAGRNAAALDDRRRLIRQFDRFRAGLDQANQLAAIDDFRDAAFELMSNRHAATAFDLSKENPALRDRYGRHLWGQGCLLARRLAEAGAAVISLFLNTPRSGPEFTNWDDHLGNAGRPGHFANYMRVRLPYLDQALSALIEDIYVRARDREILVVVVGEFGRTPRLAGPSGEKGRDHWPQAYSALVSGGGLRMGQVIGATNAKAEYPTQRPYSPIDLMATIYAHLGIDVRQTFIDRSGRPVPILNSGEPIRELAATVRDRKAGDRNYRTRN